MTWQKSMTADMRVLGVDPRNMQDESSGEKY